MFGWYFTVLSFDSLPDADGSEAKTLEVYFLILHFAGGDKCPMTIDNSCDPVDSMLAMPSRSGTKLKPR